MEEGLLFQFISAMLAGVAIAVCMNPVDLIVTRQVFQIVLLYLCFRLCLVR